MNENYNWYTRNNKKRNNNVKSSLLLIFIVFIFTVSVFTFMQIYKNHTIFSSIKKTTNTDNIPEWNLSIFYSSVNNPQIDKDISEINNKVDNFYTKYLIKKNLIASPNNLSKAMIQYEKISEKIYHLNLYANLLISKNSANLEYIKLYAKVKDVITKWNIKLLDFSLILSNLPNTKLNTFIQAKQTAKYAFFLKDLNRNKKHILSKKLEQYSIDKSSALDSAIVDFYDKKLTSISVKFKNKIHPLGSAIDILNFSENATDRKEMATLLSKEFDKKADDMLFIYNSLLKSKNIEDSYRKYSSPVESENIANYITQKTLNNLTEVVESNYANTVHKYYNLKAKYLGLKKIDYSDKNSSINKFKHNIPWNVSKNIVLSIYKDFSSNSYNIIKEFFDKNKIDALPTESKYSGAFCTSYNSFVLLNYTNNLNSLSTLMHELGHGLQMQMSKKNGFLLGTKMPLALAEIPSTFSENLLANYMLKNAKTKEEKIALLSREIENSINTIIRQVGFHKFETKLHSLRKNHTLTLSEIQNLWLESLKETLGPSVEIGEEYKNYWIYISHFIHHPFYVYSYAFSELITFALIEEYQKDKIKFQNRYNEFLSNMTNKSTPELLKIFNINIQNKKIWLSGINRLSKLIDIFEKEIKQ